MLKNYIKITFRSFRRRKGFFVINILGLSIGLACSLLIYLWINSEYQVDKFNEKDDQLFQVMKNYAEPDGINTGEDTPGRLADALANEMPEVEQSVSVFPPADYTFNGILTFGDTHVKANSKFAGREFFNVFSYPLLEGNGSTVLADPTAVAISEELATKLFQSSTEVVGKTIDWEGERVHGLFTVGGVFQFPPADATIQFDIVFSFNYLLDQFPQFSKWTSSGPSTYVILKENTDINNFDQKIEKFVQTKSQESPITLFTRPYSDRYLYGKYENGVLAGGRIEYIRLFTVIGIFILIIACINFMNLATAKASHRFKEIGVKKALGAGRSTLILQYLGESLWMAFMSLLLAMLFAELFMPQFNAITGKQLTLPWNTNFLFTAVAITTITGLIAGSYPALYLSGFNPANILKGGVVSGNIQHPKAERQIRKGLVVFQFVISFVLIVSVLAGYQQMEFIQSRNLGLDKDQVIHFTAEGKLTNNVNSFLSEIRKIPGISDASYMHGTLTGLHSGTSAVSWEGKDPDQTVDFESLGIGYDVIETLGIELKEGRGFSRDFNTEDSKVIFNETAIERMGIKDPVGKVVTLWGEEKQIIGVVKDFHFESLYEPIKPLFFQWTPSGENILVKIKGGKEQETLQQLADFYNEYNLGLTFDYAFLDEDYQALYVAEQRVSILSKYFAGFAILISCMGLLGLSIFTAERRQKEISIRKVLGASVIGITRLLSWNFLKLVSLASVIAVPITWYLIHEWLQRFAYRIEIGLGIFLLATGAILLIALATVSWQSIRAAVANPVESLRSE
ncbi:ABC transporter permease [Aliifodinibius sp. S!AR15-10]|uniref:ABC transporter permease n=1 Tax=Aliifodinibius sp. S!AR15-10 TaxID=2950437 RepID=UPI00285A5A44|nr:ABC transporter permease [Aliifodinibius sp. S!AR15-10]MDR8393694.1 ABC transporter permease [Aliifodinibius sp. S!AR15-10]